MTLRLCHACGTPLDHATVRLEFEGFQTLRLNGVSFTCHARCVQLVTPDSGLPLPRRISDQVAEPDLVYLRRTDDGWVAHCRDCGRDVAAKTDAEDAHLLAASHLARVHSGLVPA